MPLDIPLPFAGERRLRAARCLETLASLLDAGLSPRTALEQPALRTALGSAAHAHALAVLARGGSLAEALSAGPFAPRELARVAASEAAGRPSAGLRRVAAEAERDVAALRRALARLVYPTFVLHAAALARGLASGLFLGNDARGIAAALQVALPVDLALAAAFFAARSAAGGGAAAGPARRIPLLGALLRDLELAPFLRALRDLHDSGLPLDRAVERAAEGIAPIHAGPYLRAAADVRAGNPLVAALEREGAIDGTTTAILQPSELAGALSEGLDRAATLVESRAEQGVRAASAVPGSLLYAVAVVATAWTLYAFYAARIPSWF